MTARGSKPVATEGEALTRISPTPAPWMVSTSLRAWRSSASIGLDAREQRLARLGRGDAVGAAMQQFDAEIVFQLLDALGDRRLRQIENLGGLAHRAGLDHGGEIAQLAELHGHGCLARG